MPIPNTVLTKAEFEYLQKAIVDVKKTVDDASQIAEDAVQYIADMQIAAPEVDLIVQFNSFLTLIEGLNVSSNYTAIVAALNTHGINRGGDTSGSLSERLNSYFEDKGILVSTDYYTLSGNAGYTISSTDPDLVGPLVTLTGGGDGYPDTITALSPGLSDGTTVYLDSVTVGVSGGTYTATNPLKFEVDGLLPPGLYIIQSTGVIDGTINSGATNTTYVFTVSVTDTIGNHDKAKFSIAVTDS